MFHKHKKLMAKLEMLSRNSWKHPFTDRRKEMDLWVTHTEVADLCGLKNGTKRRIRIEFEEKFGIREEFNFQITSHREMYFPKKFQKKIRDIIFKNPESYFIATVIDDKGPAFKPSDIKWCKNVLRERGQGVAYAEHNVGDEFQLHWPTSWPGSVLTSSVGDLMLIFQTPKIIDGQRNSKVLLTHLVTPVDGILLDNPDNPGHRYARLVKVIAKADPINAIPKPDYLNFRSPNRGQTHPIGNIGNTIDLTEEELKQCIWELFDEYIDSSKVNSERDSSFPTSDGGENEGDRYIREHARLELVRRNSAIVKLAKQQALQKGNGRISCEVCGFDFVEKYGSIGNEFIECHHRIPVSTGQRITRVQDLALVCSNCHRMLHRKNENGTYHKVESLLQILNL